MPNPRLLLDQINPHRINGGWELWEDDGVIFLRGKGIWTEYERGQYSFTLPVAMAMLVMEWATHVLQNPSQMGLLSLEDTFLDIGELQTTVSSYLSPQGEAMAMIHCQHQGHLSILDQEDISAINHKLSENFPGPTAAVLAGMDLPELCSQQRLPEMKQVMESIGVIEEYRRI